jgi:hypothetical protein
MRAACQQKPAHSHPHNHRVNGTRVRGPPRLAATSSSRQQVQLYDFHDQLVPYEQVRLMFPLLMWCR